MSTETSHFALTRGQRMAAHTALVLMCIPFILPLLWMVATSLKPETEIFTGTRSSDHASGAATRAASAQTAMRRITVPP